MTDGPAIGVRFILEGKLDQIKSVLDDQNTTLETRLAAIGAAVKGMPDYGSKFDLIVASLDAIKGQAEALGTDQAGIASKIAGVTAAITPAPPDTGHDKERVTKVERLIATLFCVP